MYKCQLLLQPFATNGILIFGFWALDLDRLSKEEQALIPQQLEEYRQYGPVFRNGDCYRLASYRENGVYDAFMAVAKDKSTAVISFVQVKSRAYRRSLRLKLAGLDEKSTLPPRGYERNSLWCRLDARRPFAGSGTVRLSKRVDQTRASTTIMLFFLA